MLTILKLKREGDFVGTSPQASSRRAHFQQYSPQVSPQVSPKASLVMPHERKPKNISDDKNAFRKSLF